MTVANVDFDQCVTSLRLSDAPKRTRRLNLRGNLPTLSADEKARRKLIKKKYEYTERVTKKELKGISDKKVKSKLQRFSKKAQAANEKASISELMLTEQIGFIETTGAEKSYRLRQADLKQHVDLQNADKIFNLALDLGPYNLDYSQNGSHMVLAGRQGHISMMKWGSFKLESEIFVKETIRDVKYLHNHLMVAVAQKKYVYIYDNKGIEIHCLRNHIEPTRLDFLPYHFLLVSVSKSGSLNYQDVSTGAIVAEHRTKKGEPTALTHNPQNAVVHVGHSRGVVTLWTPNMSTAAVTVLCHKGAIQAIKVANDGNTMVTSGAEGRVAIWDLRTYKMLHELSMFSPPSAIDISQTGLLAFGMNSQVQIFKDNKLYMTHQTPGSQIQQLKFCPFQDVCAIGHRTGLSSILVPGSGEANFDAFEANPFETKAQRRQTEVKQLLDKIQPDMITLERNAIGTVRRGKSNTSTTTKPTAKPMAVVAESITEGPFDV